MKSVLLIEDEKHKREELALYLEEFVGVQMKLSTADSVRSAVDAVSGEDFDLIVLDMALPTFTVGDESVDGGLDQALGGVEILRTLKHLQKKQNVVIVTQYPYINLDGKRMKLNAARSALEKKYGQLVARPVLYKYRSSSNRQKIKGVVDFVW